MGTSIGAAIDYVVTKLGTGFTGLDNYGRPLTVPALSTFESNVNIVDVWNQSESGPWVVIGRGEQDSPAEVTAQASYQVLGRQRIDEVYTIPGMILVEDQGPVYKTVRDRALALFDGVTKIVWADPTLGGVLQNGRIGLVSSFTVTQYDPRSDNQSASGAAIAAQVTFGLQIENNYIP